MDARETTGQARFGRAGFKDPRFVVGLVLVIASVLGVVGLVQGLQRTQAVYSAARDLGAGESVGADDLVVVQVRLGENASAYWGAGGEVPPGTRVLSAVRAGELIPLRAMGNAEEERRPMNLELEGAAPAGVGVGGRIDVYVTAEGTAQGGEAQAPQAVLRSLEVTAIKTTAAGLGSTARTVIDVLVPPDDVPALVAARAADRLDVVAGAPVSPGATTAGAAP